MMRGASWFKICFTIIILFFPNIYGNSYFGRNGRNGANGKDGNSGQSGRDIIIKASTTFKEYDVRGSDGRDGLEGSYGYDATECYYNYNKYPKYDVYGASGGNGGTGGNGGNGGKGGDVHLLYDDESNLKNVLIRNSGGEGGAPGRGGSYGGNGCQCKINHWEYFNCRWRIERFDKDNPSYGWQTVGYHEKVLDRSCHSFEPNPYQICGVNFKCRAILESDRIKRYFCYDGDNGSRGRTGSQGNSGYYGKVVLYKRNSIPQEMESYSGKFQDTINKSIVLKKNAFDHKDGLRKIISSNSDVNSSYYQFVKTVTTRVKILWGLSKSLNHYHLSNKKISIFMALGTDNKYKIHFYFPNKDRMKFEQKQISEDSWEIKIVDYEIPIGNQDDSCSQWDGKGSYLCELHKGCEYFPEDFGLCKKVR